MRFHLLAFLFLCSLSYTTAQELSSPSKFGYLAFQTRYLQPDFTKFNREVNAEGFTGIKEDGMLEFGVAVGEQTSRRVSSFALSWVAPEGKGNQAQTQYRHLMVESETTFSFLKKNRAVLGATLGLGGRWSHLLFVSAEEATSFSQAQGIEYRKYKNFGIPIWAGLDMDFIIGKKNSGFLLGIGAGYRYDQVRKWNLDDAVLWKTKNVDLSGFYGTVRVGIAGRSSFDKKRGMRNTSL